MLSGENGILNKAKEAKEKTEDGQKQEETTLSDYEINMHFITNNSKYKCRYGMITGIDFNEEAKGLKEEIAKIGYELKDKDCNNIINDADILGTGMAITKDGDEIARVVIFGDITGNGNVKMEDVSKVTDAINGVTKETQYKDYQLAAMDVNQDSKVNGQDRKIIENKFEGEGTIDQDKYASNLNNIIIETNSYIKKQYIKKMQESLKSTNYTITFSGETCLVNGCVQEGLSVEALINLLPEKENITIKRSNELLETGPLQRGDKIVYKYDEREINIANTI